MKYFLTIVVVFLFLLFGFTKLSNRPAGEKSNYTTAVSESIKRQMSSVANVKQNPAPEQKEVTKKPIPLPLISDWKNTSDEDLHNGPQLLSQKSKWLGDIVAAAEADVNKKPESLRELRSCAQNKELVPSVRASCIISYLDLEPNAKLIEEFGKEDSQVLELAQFLLD